MRYGSDSAGKNPGGTLKPDAPGAGVYLELWSSALHGVGDERDYKQDQKDKEQNFRKPCRCPRDTTKTKYPGDNRDDQAYDSPIEHSLLLLNGFISQRGTRALKPQIVEVRKALGERLFNV